VRPSVPHEDAKKIIARLVEAWAMERDVDLRGFGGATFRHEAKERGLEPDECYKLGKLDNDGVPDIAIEVIVTTSLVDKQSSRNSCSPARARPGWPSNIRQRFDRVARSRDVIALSMPEAAADYRAALTRAVAVGTSLRPSTRLAPRTDPSGRC
jgi:hypothetical protein